MTEEEREMVLRLLGDAGLTVLGAHVCDDDGSLVVRVKRKELRS